MIVLLSYSSASEKDNLESAASFRTEVLYRSFFCGSLVICTASPRRERHKPGFPRWLPNWGGYSRFTGLSARQKCGPGGYRQLGRPERWSRGLSGHFRWYLDTLLPSVAVERMTIGRLTQALVAAVAGVPQSGAVSLGTIHSAPRLRPSGR